jgi:starch phosphorylase
LARWKKKVAEAWPGVRMRFINALPKAVNTGECMPIEVAVHLNGLSPKDVAVECVLGKENEGGELAPTNSIPLSSTGPNAADEIAYRVDLCAPKQGMLVEGLQHYKIRAYPYSPLLSHRFECGCMLWL